ncbi:MAG: phospholipase D-like domain-containing protein [Candidatus Angelobacter sp.]
MPPVSGSKNSFTIKAYIGDNKTLLAFNFSDPGRAKNLAGFTIQCQPPGKPAYYLFNELQFADPTKHAQVATEKPNSTINAPIQKYRWTHVLGLNHQGLSPAVGNYAYTVTPRYFDAQTMKPLDATLSASVTVPVGPFKKGSLSLGFTRGYMQSEAFVHHFGPNAQLQPAGKPLLYDTNQQAGTSPSGQTYTFEDEYAWMGSTARQQLLAVLNTAVNDPSVHVDAFAYDLNDPTVMSALLTLGKQGRVRIILDNAQLHITHTDSKTKKTVVPPEDKFTDLFKQQAKAPAALVRGCFNRYSHDKIFILSRNGNAFRVITGSTNWSVTGLYVNANHVLVFDDANVAAQYAKMFAQSWQILSKTKTPSKAAANAFSSTPLATQASTFQSASVPSTIINFSPHTDNDVNKILGAMSNRITKEGDVSKGNVLFAVMQLTGSQSPVYSTLSGLHAKQSLFSYGISDAPQGTFLYAPGAKSGVMVTGKPGQTILPPPFDQVPTPPGHEIHDKFVVCGLNGNDPVVYCGSSNLATGGEAANGDNLLEVHDADVATAFAIEALLLVDHYNFLDRMAKPKSSAGTKAPKTPKKAAGKAAGAKA